MSVQPTELRDIARDVLKLLGVTSYTALELTYALKDGNKWKVSFSYAPSVSFTRKVGCFKVNAESGEIEGMWLDRTWK